MHKNNRTSSKTKTFLTEYFEPEFDNNLHLGLAPLDLSTTAATSKHAAYNSVIEAAAPGARSEGEEMPKEDKVQGAIREDEEIIDHYLHVGEKVVHEHPEGPQLGEVVRLDTVVTMIDSTNFHNTRGSLKTNDECSTVGPIAQLMMDQVEVANEICLNECHLVKEKQMDDMYEKIAEINEKSKIMKTYHSKVNPKDILNTHMYKDKEEFFVTFAKQEANMEANLKAKAGMAAPDTCTTRFDINSFVYRARKPFHPGRLHSLFLEEYFMDMDVADSLEKLQAETTDKQIRRTELMGELLMSKGLFWMATSNDVIGLWQQAGNVIRSVICLLLEIITLLILDMMQD